MSFKVIETDAIDTRTLREKYPIPEQHGPVRHYDREMRCALRGCGSSTFIKVYDLPRCMTHALRDLNDKLYEMGEDANG